jgi:hypothetical protein
MHDKEDKELYVEVQLHQHRNILKRVLVAIKYILGYTSKYGHWDCTLISKSEAIRLGHFIRNYTK